MKIYALDRGVFGLITVVAENEAAAREVMKSCENYDADAPVTENAIVAGLCLYNLGDL